MLETVLANLISKFLNFRMLFKLQIQFRLNKHHGDQPEDFKSVGKIMAITDRY